jgi:hypothetical protein
MNSRRCIAGHASDILNPSVSDYEIKVQAVECPSWVKLRKTQREQMSSGLPLIADIDGFSDARDRQQNVDALQRARQGKKVQRKGDTLSHTVQ